MKKKKKQHKFRPFFPQIISYYVKKNTALVGSYNKETGGDFFPFVSV